MGAEQDSPGPDFYHAGCDLVPLPHALADTMLKFSVLNQVLLNCTRPSPALVLHRPLYM